MTPHKCPVCEGTGMVWQYGTTAQRPCHVCNGTCILWAPDSPPADIFLGPNGHTDPSSMGRMTRRLLGD